MDIPLPNRHDRYRILGIIFRYLTYGDTQETLGTQVHIHQSTISRWISLNALEDRALKGHALSREKLLKLACRGLSLNYREASLFLWLAAGASFKKLTGHELSQYPELQPSSDDLAEGEFFQHNPLEAYWAALDWLKATAAKHYKQAGLYDVNVLMFHGNSPEYRIQYYRKLLEIEVRPGQRILVSKFPSILVSADIDQADDELMKTPEPYRMELRNLLKSRQDIFKHNLAEYGERSIHSIASLRRFVSSRFEHSVLVAERRKRVKNLIDYLDTNKKFHVGLADLEPEVEIAIKSTVAAIIRGTARELSNHPQTIICGPSHLFWIDKEAEEPWGVMDFFLDFEEEWRKLHKEGKTDRQYTINQLKGILAEAEAEDKRPEN